LRDKLIGRGGSMAAVLFSVRGNARACLFTEPLWAIPNSLAAPFFTLYMYSLGARDAQIGMILSAGLLVQVASAVAGGALADKFGRRRTLVVVDTISWTIPCLLWAFAADVRWFLAAALLNGLQQISNNSWTCLLVEDTEQELLVKLFSWIYVCQLIAVFFAPITGALVGHFSLVPVMRGIYLLSTVMMTMKFVMLFLYSTETGQGRRRMAETRGESLIKLFAGYRGVFAKIVRNPRTARATALISISAVTFVVSGNFFSLYATQNLGIGEVWIAWFPIVRAAVMLFFFFAPDQMISRYPMKNVLLFSLGLYVAGHAFLISASAFNSLKFVFLIMFLLLDAAAGALFMPRRDAFLIMEVDPVERARTMSIVYTIMLGLTSPFGYAAGLLSGADRRLPFVLNVLLFFAMAAVIWKKGGEEA